MSAREQRQMPDKEVLHAVRMAWMEAMLLRDALSNEGDEAAIYSTPGSFWNDRSLVLPIIARHLSARAAALGYASPRPDDVFGAFRRKTRMLGAAPR